MAELNARQRQFCREYLIDLNATQAYIRAGYAKKGASQAASRLLANVKIQGEIQDLLAKRSALTEITAENVLREQARIAFSDKLNYCSFNGGGVAIRDSSELTEDQSRAISEVRFTPQGEIRIKLHPKQPAIESLMKHLCLYPRESQDEKPDRSARITFGGRRLDIDEEVDNDE